MLVFCLIVLFNLLSLLFYQLSNKLLSITGFYVKENRVSKNYCYYRVFVSLSTLL